MKILVLLKQTPDTEAELNLSASKESIDESNLKFIVNPYDEYAIEEALNIKSKHQDAEVIIASFGKTNSKERIVKGLAMGADRGILISNEGLEEADSLVTAKILAQMVRLEKADIVLCGKQGIDADNMHIPAMVAEYLKWPHINVVSNINYEDNTLIIDREVEGGQVERYKAQYPIVIGANKNLNTPRYASLPGIMKAKKKPFNIKTPADLDLNIEDLKSSIQTNTNSFEYPPQKPKGKVFKDQPVQDMVSEVVKLLREEAKVI